MKSPASGGLNPVRHSELESPSLRIRMAPVTPTPSFRAKRGISPRGSLLTDFSAHRHRQVLMHQQPARAASFPNSSVTDVGVARFAIFRRRRNMHGHGHPGDVPAPRDFQLLAGGKPDR